MFSSRLFWKLWLCCAGLNVVATIALGAMFATWKEQAIWQQAEQRLLRVASTRVDEIATPLAAGEMQSLRRYVANMGESAGLQVVVLDKQDSVVARFPESMKPAASSLAPANARTFSSNGSVSLERALIVGDRVVGTLELSLDSETTQAQIAAMRRSTWLVAGGIAILVLVAVYYFASQVARPIAELRQAADAIAVGNYLQRVYVPHRDEMGGLARSFNRMSQELDSRMTQLQQSGQRQATVLGGMVEGVIAVDERQRVLFANRAAGRLFDFRPSAVEGRPLLEVVRVHALHEAVSAALNKQDSQRLETEFDTGDKLTVAIQATPLPGDPSPGAVLVLHDMTELRRLERVRQEFVANVSHELKTPLSSIKAYAETLRNGALNDPATSRKFISQIEEQADRLHYLILDMLTLARIETDQQAFEIVSVSVEEVVNACMAAHQASADAKQISLKTELDAPNPKVKADREGLRAILDNLIDNAVKYTPENGCVTIRCRTAEQMAILEVEDTGIGISQDDVPRVFERFYRVDKARSRELGGTGLGLSIVKHLAQSFGGKVGLRSQKGRGSTFSVELPLT